MRTFVAALGTWLWCFSLMIAGDGVAANRPNGAGRPVGPAITFQLWKWSADPAQRQEVLTLRDGLRLAADKLPGEVHLRFRVSVPHDAIRSRVRTSDAFDQFAWGPEAVERSGSAARHYRAYAEHLSYPPQVGRYTLDVEATDGGKVVARGGLTFQIVNDRLPPVNARYFEGKKDGRGVPITTSAPVVLPPLNETPVLRDLDYPFEPQQASHVVHFGRFPPFRLPPRFLAVWGSRRFSDEESFGGPLDRGFTAVAHLRPGRDNLPIAQRTWFHTPDQQVEFIRKWHAAEPRRFADLKSYADHRSAFVSAENAYKLGWTCYESWGAGGYGPFDAGLYGWDEEQMWPTIAAKLLREHPTLLPAELRKLRERDPEVKHPDTLAALESAYSSAWGDFVGHTYRGARACAAARGRTIKVWHYGSKAPGEHLFVNRDEGKPHPTTGRYACEEIGALWPWFRRGDRIDFTASEYARQIDYFHKDFYYHTLFAHQASMYEKGSDGRYALDDRGRRVIRRDVLEERLYGEPVRIGHEDCEIGPVFLKAFLAKGENALYWLNGGRTYKLRGTLVTDKQLIPALRPGNQETWGESAKLGSRPVTPYLAEAAVIYTFLMGLEGMYLWDARNFTAPAGRGARGVGGAADSLGDMEFMVKGMHRVSGLAPLFEGKYAFVRPVRHHDTYDRDHPLIRGIVQGRYLALAMTNPYLDPGESQQVELWYDTPYAGRQRAVWSGSVRLQTRRTHLFQCKLPPLPDGAAYDADRLYLRYTCADGSFRRTYFVTGNHDVRYPHAE